MALEDKLRTSYKNLVKKLAAPPSEAKSAEEKLDALLNTHQQRCHADPPDASPPLAPLDLFRKQLREELLPAFEELQVKYGEQGVNLNMDASDFLQGGRRFIIDFAIQPFAVRMDGTVIDSGIAFNEIRSIGGVAGAICSGPMLRTRHLTTQQFREFICGRIALLVRSVLRQKR